MIGISEEFVAEFRQRRIQADWDLWQFHQWLSVEEVKLVQDNPGLYYYITGVLAGLNETLDTPLKSLISERLYFHFIELLAIVHEHEEVESLEKLWEAEGR